MKTDWMESIREKDRRKNQILFDRDTPCLTELLAEMEKQSRLTLVRWVFDAMTTTLEMLHTRWPEETRPQKAFSRCWDWAKGNLRMPEAKRAILAAHAAAKDTQDPVCAALCHAIGQGCSTVHTGRHAPGLPFYELTALVRLYGLDACREVVEERISRYQERLHFFAAHEQDAGEDWAPFLLKE